MCKKLILLVPLVVVLAMVSNAWADLVVHYKFDADFQDSSGNGIHGTTPGGVPQFVAGAPAGLSPTGAILLDGVDDYVQALDPALDITGSVTLAAWVKIDGWPYDDVRYDNIIWKTENVGGSRAFRLSRDSWDDEACLTIIATGGEAKVRGATVISDNLWHHVAGVYDIDTGDALLYVDGALDASASTSGAINDNTGTPLFIGAEKGVERFWAGAIDDVRIYDHALSAGDIAAIVPEPATIALLGLGASVLLRRRK